MSAEADDDIARRILNTLGTVVVSLEFPHLIYIDGLVVAPLALALAISIRFYFKEYYKKIGVDYTMTALNLN